MAQRRSIPVRSDPDFKKMLNDVKLERLKTGKNHKMLGDRRLTLAISRVPNLKKLLTEWEIKDEE